MRYGGKKGNVLRLIFEAFWGDWGGFSFFCYCSLVDWGMFASSSSYHISIYYFCVTKGIGNTVNNS